MFRRAGKHGLALACLGLAALAAPAAADDELDVLFIGNSYTRFNDLPRMVGELSESAPGPRVRTERATHGGFDLRLHWQRRPEVRRQLAHGRYDAVVLQGHSLQPISEPWRLAEYARRFAHEAHAGGARVVLFQTWAHHRRSRYYRESELSDPSEMLARIDAVYAEIAQEVDGTVAPVGRAWQIAAEEYPTEELHRRDGTHPDLAGTYLSACVLYGTLTGRDPRAASWQPPRLSPRQGARIRAVAAATLLR